MVFVVQKGQMVVIMRGNSWRWGWCGDWNWDWFDSSTSGAAAAAASDVTATTASGIRDGFGGIIAVPWFRMTTVGWKADLVCPITMASTNWVGILLITKNESILIWFPPIKFPVYPYWNFKEQNLIRRPYLHWKIIWNKINLQVENRFLLNLEKWEKQLSVTNLRINLI